MRLSHGRASNVAVETEAVSSAFDSPEPVDGRSDPDPIEGSLPRAGVDAVDAGLGMAAGAVVGGGREGCAACVADFLSSLERFARRRRPNTQGALARVHRSHGTEPPESLGTLHLSL
jgi:hypothetical protein